MSSLIPSVFSRIDFWAMLLPGYVFIILGMILFFPSFLLTSPDENTDTEPNATTTNETPTIESDNIQFDIFSAVVFIVAGPANAHNPYVWLAIL